MESTIKLICAAINDCDNNPDMKQTGETLRAALSTLEQMLPKIKERQKNRVNIVMGALKVEEADARKIVSHLEKLGFAASWIDNFNERSDDESLVDVHYETEFSEMLDWYFEGFAPSKIIEQSANIKEHPAFLELSDGVICWYSLI